MNLHKLQTTLKYHYHVGEWTNDKNVLDLQRTFYGTIPWPVWMDNMSEHVLDPLVKAIFNNKTLLMRLSEFDKYFLTNE